MLSTVSDLYQATKNQLNKISPQAKTAIGVGAFVSLVIYKGYDIGVWKFKSENPNIPLLFYQPFFGAIGWLEENANDHPHQKITKECLKLIKETGEKFVSLSGPKMVMGFNHNYFIFDPKILKLIFEDKFTDFIKGPNLQDAFFELLGKGIFMADPPEWKFHRKVASRMFSMNNLKNYMFNCSLSNAEILINKMNELSQSKDTEIMDLFELFGRFTLQSFMQTAFGEKLQIIQSLPKPHPFGNAFDHLIQECEHRTFDFFWKFKKYFKIGQREKIDIPSHTKTLNDFAIKIIKQREKLQFKNEKGGLMDETREKHDLLSLFMKYNIDEQNEKHINSIDDIRDITMNFVIAARDTTRILLSWFFYEITKKENKHILKQLNEEIMQYKDEQLTYKDVSIFVGGKKSNKNMNTNDKKYLYLETVLSETLRLHPPVPFLQRFATKDVLIPYTDFNGNKKQLKIETGEGVVCYTCAYLRLPQIWGNNADKFDPTRFKNGINTYDMYQFPVFNINPRLCLGKTAAIMQAKMMAILILRNYEIEPIPNQDVDSPFSPILAMNSDGFKIKIKAK